MDDVIAAATWLVLIAGVVVVFARLRRRRGIGPGASGTIHDMINEDKRKAIEIIAEERAEARDPETADGRPWSGRNR